MKTKYQRNKKLFDNILNKINNNNNTVSVSLVGSFSQKFDFDQSGDIDIVVICDELKKNYFHDTQKEILNYKKKLLFFSDKKKLKLNLTFGPIKFDNKNTLVIHLMIYDVRSHMEHVIKSPFTCFDWERTSFFKGKKLSHIYPVLKLQMSDFINSRRGTNNILKDLKNRRISYGQYIFTKNKVILKKKYHILDDYGLNIFIYHIFTNSIKNLLKFQSGKNINFSSNKLYKKLEEITEQNNRFKNLDFTSKLTFIDCLNRISENKILITSAFIQYFKEYIKKILLSKRVHFIRHKKTKYKSNIFLGTKINPSILALSKISNKQNLNYDICYSSPMKRTLETASILIKKELIKINKNLTEINYGKYEGLTFDEVKLKDPRFSNLLSKNKDPKFPNGENTKDVLNRINKFINFLILSESKNKLILVVTHNVFMRCLIGSFLGIKINDWYKIKIPYFTKFEIIVYERQVLLNISRTKIKNILKNIYG